MKNHFRSLVAILAAAYVGAAASQSTNLGQVVSGASNSTSLQVTAGDAVQNTCLQLVPKYPGSSDFTGPARTSEQDLYFRCSEVVLTAVSLQPGGQADNVLGWVPGQLAETMQQLSGEEQVSKGRLATESSNGQFANIGMRLEAIRNGARATAGGLSLAMNGVPVVGGNAGEDESRWSWFANGVYGTGDRDATQLEDQYDFDSSGATLGVDYLFDSGFVAGIAFGYADYEVDFKNVSSGLAGNMSTSTVSGGGFSLDGYSLSAYGIGNIGRFYVDGLLSYGFNDYETERIVLYSGAAGLNNGGTINRSMTGETDSDSLAVGVSTGTVFDLGFLDLAVDLGLSYLDITVDGYTEKDTPIGSDIATSGGLNLAYEDQDIESLQSALGFQISKNFSVATGVIVPYLGIEWRHEFDNDARFVKARFAAQDGGPVFPINMGSDDPDEDFYELGLGISAVFAQNLTGFIDYRTTLDLDNISADLYTIGIRGSF
ncbi:autotransporter outer membrane beta-barrel domain-containing protein [Parahaliea maris]|nr:autotransporter outer membrane beta-barrel domain-containing protein [Parahaliea maris]